MYIRLGLRMQAHHRVFASFFLYAFSMGGFYPRLADIQLGMNVDKGTLGLALIGVASGTLFALTFLAHTLDRIATRVALLTLLPCVAFAYAVASHVHSPLTLFCVLFLAGLCLGCLQITVNLEADRVEHQLGRRIMNRSHSFWSFGFFGAGAFSALFSHLNLSAQLQLGLTVPLVLFLTLILLGRFDGAPSRIATETNASRLSFPTSGILLLVACCASALLLEGAGIDWSAIYMRDVFQSSSSVSALTVSIVALAQACTRFIADSVTDRWSPATVARGLLTALLVGATIVTLATRPELAMFGFALIGAGSSAIFPLAMSAAAQRTDRPAAVNVASLAQTGFVIFLLAPPTLGMVAEHMGIRSAYGICLPIVIIGLFSCSALQVGTKVAANVASVKS